MNKTKKTKSMIAMALTLLMVVSVLSTIAPALAANENVTLSLVPSTDIDLTYPDTLPLDSTFTVAVNVNDVTNLYGDVIGLSWPTAIVHVTKVEAGAFLKSAGGATFSPPTTIDNSGAVGSLPSLFNDVAMDDNNPSGSGTLCVVTFKVVGFGSGSISITSARLVSDSAGTDIPIATTLPHSIALNNPTPPPHGPTAKFAIAANPATVSGTYITIPNTASSTDIVLDASTSLAGFDGSASVPVDSWTWTINDDVYHTETVSLAGITAADSHLAVQLTVGATGAVPETDTKSVTYTVLQAAATGVDVYTENGGTGPDTPSGPFGPQQEVTVYADVFSNGAPVAQKDVIFQVNTPSGALFFDAVARTGSNGIASVSFRLPTPDTQLETAFGFNWTIVAVVDISEVQYMDSATFEFNYLANIESVSASSPVVRGTGSVTIDVTTSTLDGAVISSNALVTITVVDSNNVPVAASTASLSENVEATLAIPNYAFTGSAKVYVNILSNQPTMSGTPYCPQNGAVVTFDTDGLFVSSVQNDPAQFQISYVA
ncbi:MAG: cohesin domain-containing protein [Candidatus Bathyarchaeia archaeon]